MALILNQTATEKGVAVLNRIISNDVQWEHLPDSDLLAANKSVQKSKYFKTGKDKSQKVGNLAQKYNYSRHANPKRQNDCLRIVSANRKTGVSIDVLNGCFYTCDYCYMKSPHNQAQVSERLWTVAPDWLDDNKEKIWREFLADFKQKAGKGYALRFFAMADCPDTHIPLIVRLLKICKEENVDTIVISKNVKLFPRIIDIATTTLMSIDTGGYNSPTSIEEYVELNRLMPTLRAFFMIVDFEELKTVTKWHRDFSLSNWQIVAYHGQLKPTEKKIGNVTTLVPPPVESSIEVTIKPEFLNILMNQTHKAVACTKCFECPFMCGTRNDLVRNYRLLRIAA